MIRGLGIGVRGLAALVLCFICFSFLLPVRLDAADPVSYKNVTVQDIPLWVTQSQSYFPVLLRVGNAGPSRQLKVEVTAVNGNSRVTSRQEFTLEANDETLLEIPAMHTAGGRRYVAVTLELRFWLNGESFGPATSVPYSSNAGVPSFVFFGSGKTVVEDHVRSDNGWKNRIELLSFPTEYAPRNWQSYMGLNGVVVVDARAVDKMLPSQREALCIWVRQCGGIVWVVDDAGASVARQIGFSGAKDKMKIPESSIIQREDGIGWIWYSGDQALSGYSARVLSSRAASHASYCVGAFSTFRDGYRDGRSRSQPALNSPSFLEELLAGLKKVPKWGFGLISVALALVIGPLNFWYLRKKKKIFWFYFTAPCLAFIGISALAVYSLTSEGLGMKYNEYAMLIVDPESEQGAVYQSRGIYAGMSLGELVYPQRTVAAGFGRHTATSHFNYQPGSDFVLNGGWVMPRSPCGVTTMTLVAPRMGIELVKEGKEYFVENRMNYRIEQCWVRKWGKSLYAENVLPGQKARLVQASKNKLFKMPDMFYHPSRGRNWDLLARMESLPYLENGGAEGTLLSGDYWYLLLR